jgi:hypothetical protein
MYLFHQLPEDLRREQFVFSAAAQVIEVLQGLTGKPIIDRGRPATAADPAEADPLNQAIQDALDRDEA